MPLNSTPTLSCPVMPDPVMPSLTFALKGARPYARPFARLDRFLELPKQLLIRCVRANPEPHNFVSIENADGAPVDVNAYRVDR